MAYYQKKPGMVEAYQWDGTKEGIDALMKEAGYRLTSGVVGPYQKPYLDFWTGDKNRSVWPGDYLVKICGVFQLMCKNDFEQEYVVPAKQEA